MCIYDCNVYEVIKKIIKRALEKKIYAGIHVGSVSYARKMVDLGFSFISILSESMIMSDAANKIIKEIKNKKNDEISSLY